MNKVDVPQFLISTAAIGGIGLLWFEFNKKVFHTARDLLYSIIYEYSYVYEYYTDEETDSDTDEKTD